MFACWVEEIGATFADVSGDHASHFATFALCDRSGNLSLLEHDVLPTKAGLEEVWYCRYELCSIQYDFGDVGL